MGNSMLFAVAVMLAQTPASGQSTDAGSPPQTTLNGNGTGGTGTGAPANKTEPAEFVPMTPKERFAFYLRRTYGIESIFESAAGAGIDQADNTPKEWKQGAEAYGDRFGSLYAVHVIRGTLEYGASAALREDNRYVRSRETGFCKRSRHAIASTVIARDEAGHKHFAYSRFGSAAGAAFISRLWQPRSTDSAGDAAEQFGFTIGVDVGGNLVREFWPDVKQHFRKRK